MEFKDLPVPFQEMASNVVRSQLATLDLSTVEKETIDTISGNVRRAFIGLYEEKRLFGGQNSTENKNQANDEKLKHIIALLFGRRKTSTATGTKCRHRGPHLDCHEITQM